MKNANAIDASAHDDHVERRVLGDLVDHLLACFGHDLFLRGGALRSFGIAGL
jgi:hypothetical protein